MFVTFLCLELRIYPRQMFDSLRSKQLLGWLALAVSLTSVSAQGGASWYALCLWNVKIAEHDT